MVDCFDNFIFAADTKGMLTIFLIDENDMENEEDTLKQESFVHASGIEYLKHQIKNDKIELIAVNGQGEVYSYEIELQAPGTFAITNVTTFQLPFAVLP